MEIKVDEVEYDHLQHQLIREIAKAIKFDLEQAGFPQEGLYDAVGNLAFSIAAILDGSRVVECDGKPLIPVVAFLQSQENKSLVINSASSFMHEYANGDVDELFAEEFG